MLYFLMPSYAFNNQALNGEICIIMIFIERIEKPTFLPPPHHTI